MYRLYDTEAIIFIYKLLPFFTFCPSEKQKPLLEKSGSNKKKKCKSLMMLQVFWIFSW